MGPSQTLKKTHPLVKRFCLCHPHFLPCVCPSPSLQTDYPPYAAAITPHKAPEAGLGTSVLTVGADEPSRGDFACAQCDSCKSGRSEKPWAQKSTVSSRGHSGHYWAVTGTLSFLRIALNDRLPSLSKRLRFPK